MKNIITKNSTNTVVANQEQTLNPLALNGIKLYTNEVALNNIEFKRDDSLIDNVINYTGGKKWFLEELLASIPENINTFVDVFGGAFTVGVNVTANAIIYNEKMNELADLIENLSKNTVEFNFNKVQDTIKEFGLTKGNKEAYLNLMKSYNDNGKTEWFKFITLIIFAGFSRIRFSKDDKFNSTFGATRDFNKSLQRKFKRFTEALIEKKNITYSSEDYSFVRDLGLGVNDFVYVDPPYLITRAEYNKGWKEAQEEGLLALLDELHADGVKFALSNVFHHKGETNHILIKWAKKYHVSFIDKKYEQGNIDLENETVEVFITNYKIKNSKEAILLLKQDKEIIQGRLVDFDNEIENIKKYHVAAEALHCNAKSIEEEADKMRLDEVGFRKLTAFNCKHLKLKSKGIKGAYTEGLEKAGISLRDAQHHMSIINNEWVMALTNKQLIKMKATYTKLRKLATTKTIEEFEALLKSFNKPLKSESKETSKEIINPFADKIGSAYFAKLMKLTKLEFIGVIANNYIDESIIFPTENKSA